MCIRDRYTCGQMVEEEYVGAVTCAISSRASILPKFAFLRMGVTSKGLSDMVEVNRGAAEGEVGRPEAVEVLSVSYTHLRAHETVLDLVCRLLLEKKKNAVSTGRH
eukprot:TRINITY_DN30742_c0_g1_i1.p1 TRINITY_DN30742_c0_g1~~TRINITY_DN30742_c0_g1_i1.p1  ORF type:complete len:118 (-),score=36.84 TRINITY_DN30742_c0_g1_i1:41-358(-)